MTAKLSDELRQAVAEQPGQPVPVEDPVTHARYVLLQLEVYERLQRALEYEASEPNPREFYPLFAEAVKDDLDAPGMDAYEDASQPPDR